LVFVIFFYLFSMELSRFHDLGHEFSKLIQVDFIHFLGHFLIEYVFFKKNYPPTT